MHTPIYDFLRSYLEKDMLRMHMPGHKGRIAPPLLHQAAGIDITEIAGADSLFEANGVIMQSERNAAKLFRTAHTFYSCAGSTLCIQAMLLLMKQERRTIIAARNVHRSFLNACVLLDLHVRWVYPRVSHGILSGEYAPEDFEQVLASTGRHACVYLTSPDYVGRMADIPKIAEICHAYQAKLLVDNAHGAHLAFLGERMHPVAQGADFCCDSAHKMLSGLTGTAYLHIRSDYDTSAARIREAMAMFASTSPSYLMLASLDWCNRELASPLFREQLNAAAAQTKRLRTALAARFSFIDGDPMHLSIDAAQSGCDGRALAEHLYEQGICVEYADRYDLVMLCSAADAPEDYQRITDALACYPVGEPMARPAYRQHIPEQVCSIREAALAPQETIPVERAAGRICAQVKIPCPPAVPIIISGERIEEDSIALCQAYEIRSVNVVR